jgi:hypothetical protein
MGDGKRVEGFSLAQARVVVQEGSLLRDYWGCVQRGWRNNGWVHTPPPVCKSAPFGDLFREVFRWWFLARFWMIFVSILDPFLGSFRHILNNFPN